MAFSPEDFEPFIAELQRNPQLRERVRSVILADDFLALPRIVADLVERMDQLTGRVDQLASRMEQFASGMGVLADRMGDLLKVVQLHDGRLGNLDGRMFELDYRSRMPSRLGRRYMKVRPVHVPELEPVSLAYGNELAAAEWDDLLEIDAAAWAQPRSAEHVATPVDILVVLELSLTVNSDDVRRVHRRAEILRRLGLSVDAAVDGDWIRPEAKQLADQLGVVTLVVKEPQAA
ncbi:MAG: hypothetical protein WD557_15725 [Dehalococcoidia bacterium]